MTTTDPHLPNTTHSTEGRRSPTIAPGWAIFVGIALALRTILSIVGLRASFPDRFLYAIPLSLLAAGLGAAYVARRWRQAGSPFTKENWAVAFALGFVIAMWLCGMTAEARQVYVFIAVG